jgi:uncharacterized delta-60 repeat protein
MWKWFSRLALKHRTHRARRCYVRPHLEALEDRYCPSGGSLNWSDPTGGLFDPTFGSGGTNLYTTGVPGKQQALTSVTVLPDGKLLASGYMSRTTGWSWDFAAARYNADGAFDTSFGSGGVATFGLSKGGADLAMAAAIQPGTGKILLGGTIGGKFGLIRLNLDGTLDTTFGAKGSGGVVTASPDNHYGSYAYSMVVLPDGKILLAGLAFNLGRGAEGSLALARFNANGTLDTTFGNRGTVLTTITAQVAGNNQYHPVNVVVDGNGRIVVAATHPTPYSDPDFLVARFNANGSLDTTFGPAHTGVVTTDLASGSEDYAYALTLQNDGKIVVGGLESTAQDSPAGVVRYNSDGSLDQTFGSGGVALIDADPLHISMTAVHAAVVQADGKILLAADGGYYNPNLVGGTAKIIRLNANGTPDETYGPWGTGPSSISIGYNDQVSAMALQPDGRAVVAGMMNTDGTVAPEVDYFALMRFLATEPSPSPVQIGSFAAAPNPVTTGNPVTLTASGITSTNPGATVTEVAFYVVDASGIELFLGYSIQNTDGTWTLTWTPNLAPGQYLLLALAVDSTGSVSDPVGIYLDVQ